MPETATHQSPKRVWASAEVATADHIFQLPSSPYSNAIFAKYSSAAQGAEDGVSSAPVAPLSQSERA